jgi:hypothetical protein
VRRGTVKVKETKSHQGREGESCGNGEKAIGRLSKSEVRNSEREGDTKSAGKEKESRGVEE